MGFASLAPFEGRPSSDPSGTAISWRLMGKLSKIHGAQVFVMTPSAIQRFNANNMDRASSRLPSQRNLPRKNLTSSPLATQG
ncbi:hypothetical protein [Novosphingobium sp. P6W]|uniref:hypothetical protein n=1 Tax=Novosphingobium sp. P6W TaxID=1609758 RepID=UPI0005C2CF1B|nr:hypothetical protein [Novosphingobium sp. P6W]AXB79282.1 hypothetical protein TQ38_022570 [Novosphingobium sp. P6W]KIS30570.1 hypothetical protein TQ38_22095 [Novosphingobium sp. P6W]